ncbi:MAG: 30S ribosomal protein S27ae [Candidatus Diapherotrites archaeon]|nr:30S ribosomal protein S27ae [Candidatus Diapherotrites archaeon]
MAEKKKKKYLKSKFYEYKGDSLDRLRPFCPKCGPGVFMAEHKDRYTCGSCGYTKWKEK